MTLVLIYILNRRNMLSDGISGVEKKKNVFGVLVVIIIVIIIVIFHGEIPNNS